jgi:hypothetical protein
MSGHIMLTKRKAVISMTGTHTTCMAILTCKWFQFRYFLLRAYVLDSQGYGGMIRTVYINKDVSVGRLT